MRSFSDSAVNPEIAKLLVKIACIGSGPGMLAKKSLFHYGGNYTYTIRRVDYR
jgi:hypothetical protein